MSLCWFVQEWKPKSGHAEEVDRLVLRNNAIMADSALLYSEDGKKERGQIEKRLPEITEAVKIPGKWSRNHANSWMGADLTHCTGVLGHTQLATSCPYNDMTPKSALEYAQDLAGDLDDFKWDNKGWSSTGYAEEVRTIESAIRYLKRWGKRGFYIHASW
jgi:hypothetical protein